MFRRWREWLLVVGSVVLAGLAAEMLFRLHLRNRARSELERVRAQASTTRVETCNLGDVIELSPEPDLFYRMKPHLGGHFCGGRFSTNGLGMRMESEPRLEKPVGVVRIAGIGDSYLFGQGVDQGQGYLEVLEAVAGKSGQRIETLNFGVPGYNAWMEAVVLAARVRHFAPNVVVVGLTGNDWDLPNFMLSRRYGDLGHSFLLGALIERFRAPPAVVGTPKSHVYEDHFLAVPEEVPAAYRHMVGFEGYRHALLRMLEISREMAARLVLFSDCVSPEAPGGATCPLPFAAGEYERIRDEVYRDPRVVLCPWTLTDDLVIPGDGHPNPEGHQHLAKELFTCLQGAGIVAPSSYAPAQEGGSTIRLQVTSPALRSEGVWPLEQSGAGARVWTKGHADLSVLGLAAGRRYRVTMGIVDGGGRPHLRLEANGSSDVVEIHGPGRVTWQRPIAVAPDGSLRWSLRVDPWRPKDRIPGSTDERELGVAIDEIELAEVTAP
jgi:GDSL-like Lipase/Acylhydrolase family